MPNPYFQFKQFRIGQDRCAMKVCTDACLFGAWAAVQSGRWMAGPFRALDIGTGTGLLSLQLAQQCDARIDALEIDRAAATQACDNILNSPWKDRISVYETDAATYRSKEGYHFIVSNPPFYENDLVAPDQPGRLARHGEGLTLAALVKVLHRNLLPEGYAAVLLPHHRVDAFLALAILEGFYLQSRLLVRHSPDHPWFRACLLLSQGREMQPETTELSIREGKAYSAGFAGLLSPFYLHL